MAFILTVKILALKVVIEILMSRQLVIFFQVSKGVLFFFLTDVSRSRSLRHS